MCAYYQQKIQTSESFSGLLEESDNGNQKDNESIKSNLGSVLNDTDNAVKPSYIPTEPDECVRIINDIIQTYESFSELLEGSEYGNQKEHESSKPAPSSNTNDTDSASKPLLISTFIEV